jgi:hypothetical protein
MRELSQFRELMEVIKKNNPMTQIEDSFQNLFVNTTASSQDGSLDGEPIRILD